MKKLLILALATLLLCLCLAFSASAQEYEVVDNLGDPSWYTGDYALITDKESKVVLSNGDGTYTAYPAYYVLKYKISVSNGAVTEAYVNGFDYSFVNEKTGKGYSAGAIYKVELPNGLTTITSGIFGHKPKEPNVVEIIMSDSMTSIADHALRDISNLKRIVFSKNLKKLGAYAFYNSKGLEEFVLPAGSDEVLDVSKENIFYGCSSLKEADLSTRKILTLGSAFLSECTSLGKVTLPDCLESIGYCSLYKNPNMYLASDFLPTSLKTVGFQFLSGCKKSNSVLFFPEGFEGFVGTHCFATERYETPDTTLVFLGKMSGTIALEQFHASSGRKLTLVFTKNTFADLKGDIVTGKIVNGVEVFVAKTADTTDTDYYTKEGTLTLSMGNAGESNGRHSVDENGDTLNYIHANKYTVYFCGGEDVEVCYGVRSNVPNGQWGKFFTTPFEFDEEAHMEADKHFDLTKVESIVNCGYDGVTSHTCALCSRVVNDIVPATNNHDLYEVSVCADKCNACEKYIQKEVQIHSYMEIYSYADGFTKGGTYSSKCENEGCSYCVDESKDSMVVSLGFSVSTWGNGKAINYGYIVNTAIVDEYERVNNCEVILGMLFAGAENFAKDEKVYIINIASSHNMMEIVIKYGNSSENDHKDIVFAGCVVEKTENGEKTTFFQAETDKTTTDYTSATYGTLYGISYNGMIAE